MLGDKRGFTSLVLILVVLGLILAGGAVWYFSPKMPPSISQEQEPAVATSTASTTINQPFADQSAILEDVLYAYTHVDPSWGDNPRGLTTSDPVNFPAMFVQGITGSYTPNGKIYPVPKGTADQIGRADLGYRGILNPVNSQKIVIVITDIKCSGAKYICTSAHKFYNYDTQSGTLDLLYAESPENTGNFGMEFQLVATQGSQIIFRTHIQGTNNICGQTWFNQSSDKYYYLDLNNLSAGVQSFVVPQNLINRDSKLEQECVNNLQ